jgi:hypothetical protein
MLLNHRKFLIKERLSLISHFDAYDIINPETSQPIGIAIDQPGELASAARFSMNKRYLPATLQVSEAEGKPPVFTLLKKSGLFRVGFQIQGNDGTLIGTIRSMFMRLGGGIKIFNSKGDQISQLKGDWRGENYRFLDMAGNEIGLLTKHWSGLLKEIISTSDHYLLSLNENRISPDDHAMITLLLAAGLAVDVVYHEKSVIND